MFIEAILTLFEIFKNGIPIFLTIFVVLALASYGVHMVRLFFKI